MLRTFRLFVSVHSIQLIFLRFGREERSVKLVVVCSSTLWTAFIPIRMFSFYGSKRETSMTDESIFIAHTPCYLSSSVRLKEMVDGTQSVIY